MEPCYYNTDAPGGIQPYLETIKRKNDFAEVVGDLDIDNAKYEAWYCMSCGNCYGIYPDNAISKLGSVKYDYCEGCGMCEAECPCDAIAMINEEI